MCNGVIKGLPPPYALRNLYGTLQQRDFNWGGRLFPTFSRACAGVNEHVRFAGTVPDIHCAVRPCRTLLSLWDRTYQSNSRLFALRVTVCCCVCKILDVAKRLTISLMVRQRESGAVYCGIPLANCTTTNTKGMYVVVTTITVAVFGANRVGLFQHP